MKLNVQKRIAADIVGCSPKRVRLNTDALEQIKESITKADIRGLINDGVITILQKKGVSRVRANARQSQRRKGRQKGHGSRKGASNARETAKRQWINKIRLQRRILKSLRENNQIDKKNYTELYLKAKGGFFRSKNH